ncbi:NAD(P)H-dependent oxidoreductase [Pseudomonas sp. MSSRFD41]|uniref:FMN-dependent NADH-azoreductase n=1 Tax=Pseudomonas sp. MSSRFD41 TaxID=1310370 RepID=UPI00163B6079|nr:NAD(P)H-dependent oxidoreductase [Pseudomonas sp. MSSRFD41]MBC2659834.1 NAD(P)H-dependent oxidoreductase [Pseudomonas sp. MSSRFD41]
MNNLLLINASPHGQVSHGHQLALELASALGHRYPHLELVERDLAAQPLPPLGPDYAHALTSPTPFDAPLFEVSERLIGELQRSDVLVIATPMHNFTLPAALKLWVDYVLRIHRTFSSGPEGKVGLLEDRPVQVLVSSGGFHQGERARQPDFLTPYLRHVLNTLGLFDLRFTYLQGLVLGDDAVRQTIEEARTALFSKPLFNPLVGA